MKRKYFKNIFRTMRSGVGALDDERNSSSPYILEFVGPSGVGKTRLSEKLIDTFEDKQIISRQILISEFSKVKLTGIHKELLDKKNKNLELQSISQDVNLKLSKYFKKVITLESRISVLSDKKLLILDEAIVHNFAPELLNTNFSSYNIDSIFQNRLICFCSASEDFIRNNLHHRNRLEDSSINHAIATSPYFRIDNQIKTMNSLREKMERSNFAFFSLNLEEDSRDENVKKAKDAFLKFVSSH